MDYDKELLEISQRANVENLTKKQLKNEFIFYTSTYKNFSTMPYKHFERVCMISDILFEMNSAKSKKSKPMPNATLDEIMKELDDLYPDNGENNIWRV